MEDFIAGTLLLFGTPTSVLFFVAGLLGGMLFGAIPGVSMLTLAAILLPYTGDMTATNASPNPDAVVSGGSPAVVVAAPVAGARVSPATANTKIATTLKTVLTF